MTTTTTTTTTTNTTILAEPGHILWEHRGPVCRGRRVYACVTWAEPRDEQVTTYRARIVVPTRGDREHTIRQDFRFGPNDAYKEYLSGPALCYYQDFDNDLDEAIAWVEKWTSQDAARLEKLLTDRAAAHLVVPADTPKWSESRASGG